MTKKSVIGFGAYPRITVGDLLALGNYKGLIDIYYGLAMCTFCAEVLEILNLTGERAIEKPGVNHEKWLMYGAPLVEQLRQIHGRRGADKGNDRYIPLMDWQRRDSTIQGIKGVSKMLNKNKNQKPKKK